MIGTSCTQFAVEDFDSVHEKVSAHFSHWEIFAEWKHELSSAFPAFMRNRGSYDMTYSIHAPITDINIAAFNDRIRESAVQEMIRTLEYAGKMNIDTITIHPGIYSMVLIDVKREAIELSKRSLKKIDKAATEYGVTAAIENMPSFPIMMGQTADELLELIDGTDLKICFDIGHANTVGTIGDFIDRFSDRIANIHIHDNFGDRDAHMTIGDGKIDFPSVLSKLRNYKRNYIIEAKSLPSAIESKKRLEKLLAF